MGAARNSSPGGAVGPHMEIGEADVNPGSARMFRRR